MNGEININERQAAIAFSKQAGVFDSQYAEGTVIKYKRQRVRAHLLQLLSPGNRILELNSGTGDDAIWLADNGYHIHATDISAGMQEILQQKIKQAGVENKITHEICSFTRLHSLQQKGPYDFIFSNFAGLNCTHEIKYVLSSLPALLSPGGKVVLVILPKFCLWEFLLIFKGKWRTATRRFFSRHGAKAHVEGVYFKCWYYNPAYIIQALKNDFDLLHLEGLCTIVPPSYIEHFAEKHPVIYEFLKKKEEKWKSKWPWKYIGDYYIISFQKK